MINFNYEPRPYQFRPQTAYKHLKTTSIRTPTSIIYACIAVLLMPPGIAYVKTLFVPRRIYRTIDKHVLGLRVQMYMFSHLQTSPNTLNFNNFKSYLSIAVLLKRLLHNLCAISFRYASKYVA